MRVRVPAHDHSKASMVAPPAHHAVHDPADGFIMLMYMQTIFVTSRQLPAEAACSVQRAGQGRAEQGRAEQGGAGQGRHHNFTVQGSVIYLT